MYSPQGLLGFCPGDSGSTLTIEGPEANWYPWMPGIKRDNVHDDVLIDVDWCWLMLIDVDWCWLYCWESWTMSHDEYVFENLSSSNWGSSSLPSLITEYQRWIRLLLCLKKMPRNTMTPFVQLCLEMVMWLWAAQPFWWWSQHQRFFFRDHLKNLIIMIIMIISFKRAPNHIISHRNLRFGEAKPFCWSLLNHPREPKRHVPILQRCGTVKGLFRGMQRTACRDWCCVHGFHMGW